MNFSVLRFAHAPAKAGTYNSLIDRRRWLCRRVREAQGAAIL
jgi:hypothetical protein